ncbi:MAG: hypothetical protein AAF628_21400 [Planctomycetota bacterium]
MDADLGRVFDQQLEPRYAREQRHFRGQLLQENETLVAAHLDLSRHDEP